MTLGQILNEIQLNNDLTEEQLLNTEVVMQANDVSGTFKTIGSKVHKARADYKMIWDSYKQERVLDPDYPARVVLEVVMVS